MIRGITVLLGCQLAGEIAVRAGGLPVPGPVLGLMLLFAGLLVIPRLDGVMRPVTEPILAHLALLFVPAGVGVIGHLGTLGDGALGLALALVGATVAALVVGAVVFVAVARLTGSDAP